MLYIIKSCIERIFNMEMEIIFPGGKRVDANYKGFTIKTDQAIYNGGENSAPAPFRIWPCLIFFVLVINQHRRKYQETFYQSFFPYTFEGELHSIGLCTDRVLAPPTQRPASLHHPESSRPFQRRHLHWQRYI